MILAIDPGPLKSAYVLYDEKDMHIEVYHIEDNDDVILMLRKAGPAWQRLFGNVTLIIEMVASYGMPVGKSIFDTCVMVGRFIQAYEGKHYLMFRREVKLHLCNSARAKDANVRQAIIDKFPATGGGKVPQIGTKAKNGPLYGVKADIWAALGLAITFAERKT